MYFDFFLIILFLLKGHKIVIYGVTQPKTSMSSYSIYFAIDKDSNFNNGIAF